MAQVLDQVTSLGPVEVPSTADVVAERLRRAIQIGSFLPGDRLPSERQFAVQLGISRLALREALRSLEDAGLLERASHGSGGGALLVAARPGAVATRKELRARRDQLEGVFEFRLACEGATAELAAARNELLAAAVEDARAAMFGPLDVVRFEVVVASTREHHERIRRAIARGQGPTARRAMVAHLVEAKDEVLAAIAIENPESP